MKEQFSEMAEVVTGLIMLTRWTDEYILSRPFYYMRLLYGDLLAVYTGQKPKREPVDGDVSIEDIKRDPSKIHKLGWQ